MQRKIILSLILIGLTSFNLIGCMNNDNNTNSKSEQEENVSIENSKTDQKDVSETSNIVENEKDKNVVTQKDSTNTNTNKNNNSKDIAKAKDTPENSIDISKQKNSISDDSLKEKVIDYIINGQENKSEAEKMKWSETFLNKVDIDILYKQYIANGGTTDDLEKFAEYITLNAPIPTDWKKLFEKDLYNTYGVKVVRLEHLEGVLYQAYIKNDGKEVPYVVVSSRTGYFHG